MQLRILRKVAGHRHARFKATVLQPAGYEGWKSPDERGHSCLTGGGIKTSVTAGLSLTQAWARLLQIKHYRMQGAAYDDGRLTEAKAASDRGV